MPIMSGARRASGLIKLRANGLAGGGGGSVIAVDELCKLSREKGVPVIGGGSIAADEGSDDVSFFDTRLRFYNTYIHYTLYNTFIYN